MDDWIQYHDGDKIEIPAGTIRHGYVTISEPDSNHRIVKRVHHNGVDFYYSNGCSVKYTDKILAYMFTDFPQPYQG